MTIASETIEMASADRRDEYVVLQTSMGHYRQRFLDVLRDRSVPVRFLVGDHNFDDQSPTEVDSPLVERTGPNVFLLGHRVGAQRHVALRAVRAPVAVVVLNPRLITTWVVVLLRRLLRRPTIAWGHAWPRRGPAAGSDRLRSVLRRVPTALVVYTETERSELLARWPRLRIFVAPNAMYQADEMRPALPAGADATDLVWIGRMIEAKHPLLAIDAFERVAERLPAACRLVMVGAGPMLEEVEQRVRTSPVRDRIELTGQVTDHAALTKIFGDAVAMVATGYLGLNVVQSLGFGVPVIHPTGEPHAPEVEALDRSNSVSYPGQDVDALARAIAEVVEDRAAWLASRPEISAEARSRYSSEAMADGLVHALEAVARGSS